MVKHLCTGSDNQCELSVKSLAASVGAIAISKNTRRQKQKPAQDEKK
jgi:hypothetical protein